LYDSPAGHEEVAERLHGSLDIKSGELAAAACIRAGDGDRILLVVHHLAVDGISWRIILADLIECYGKVRAGIAPTLVPPPVSFIQWANTLASHADNSRFISQLPYWQAVARSDDPLADVLAGRGIEKDTYGDSAVVSFELGRQETERLRLVAIQRYSTTVEDLLLCALGRAIFAIHGIATTLLTLESHGREETFGLDLGRTCGWLTVTYPFALAIPAGRDLAYQIKAVKESLRAVPDRGVGYGILRYMTPKELTGSYDLTCSPTIGFNYLGRLEAGPGDLFRVEPDAHQAPAVSPLAARPHLLDISGIIVDDMLTVSLTCSRRAFGAEQAQSLATAMRVELIEIIEHCCDGRQTEPTPSDLTYSDLTLDELEGIL
jgi:non-ribosomal peptide synthase protein (TIGR01720 family)